MGTIAVEKGPAGLTFSRDGNFAYVNNQGDKTVAVVDTASYQVIKTIPVGSTRTFWRWALMGVSGEPIPGAMTFM